MKRAFFVSALMCIIAHHILSAQSNRLVLEKVITFDKLQKTIIELGTASRPSLSILPSVAGFSVEENKGKFFLVVAKPVTEGVYSIVLNGKDTLPWQVLPSRLDTKSMKALAALKLYYGKRLAFRARLPLEAELPLQQFKIDYQLGNEPPSIDNPFSESYVGPNIPASAKKVKFGVVWVYPPTGERVPLLSKEVTPEQTPPDISCQSVQAALKQFDAKKNIYYISINGVSVDYEVPIDADNTNPNASKSIKTMPSDVEVEPLELDLGTSETKLLPYTNDGPDKMSRWNASAQGISIAESVYDQTTGSFRIILAVAGIEPSSTYLKGTVAFKVGAKIVNRKAGVAARSQSLACIIPVEIPVNTHLAQEQREQLMKDVRAAYTPTIRKEVRLSGDEFLRRQFWFAESMKKMRFSVVRANESIVKSVRTLITPEPARTPELDAAEQECTNTADIKKRIQKLQPIPQTLIDEGGSPRDCEVVRDLYMQLASHESIAHVVMLVETTQDGKLGQIIGALALRRIPPPNGWVISDLALANPMKIWSVADIKAITLTGGSLYDALQQDIADMSKQEETAKGKDIIERKVIVETSEYVPLTKKTPPPAKKTK